MGIASKIFHHLPRTKKRLFGLELSPEDKAHGFDRKQEFSVAPCFFPFTLPVYPDNGNNTVQVGMKPFYLLACCLDHSLRMFSFKIRLVSGHNAKF